MTEPSRSSRQIDHAAAAVEALRESIAVGQVYAITDHLSRDGRRMKLSRGTLGFTRIRITAVPGGRRTTYRYVKVDPHRGGNGRPDRGEHTIKLVTIARNYVLVDGGA